MVQDASRVQLVAYAAVLLVCATVLARLVVPAKLSVYSPLASSASPKRASYGALEL